MLTADTTVSVLALSGPVGVGKSTVLVEIHDVLATFEVPHACVERDALAYSWPPLGNYNETVALENLAAVWKNFRAAGAGRLVIAGVVEGAADLDGYRLAVPGARIMVCRLTASSATRAGRLHAREVGAGLQWHLRRSEELETILQAARLEDFVVSNDGRPVREVAIEVLTRAGWLAPASGTS